VNTVNKNATNRLASSPADSGGLVKVPGDWHETMSTHWFQDHMFSFTAAAHNVYKGIAGMFNIYSGLDRGNEEIDDGVNLRLPSGTAKSWGNLEYDVNLMLADKAWDQDGQLLFDIFEFGGFLGDQMTVNLVHKPYFEVERRNGARVGAWTTRSSRRRSSAIGWTAGRMREPRRATTAQRRCSRRGKVSTCSRPSASRVTPSAAT